MSQAPYFHEATETVRFWVEIDTQWVGASIGKQTLHYHYQPKARDEDPLRTHADNLPAIEAAVRHRIAEGAREPIMLREHDLRAR